MKKEQENKNLPRQEEKQLLLKDLCARLPYGVICDRLGHPKKLLAVHPYKKFPLEFDNGEYIPSDYELEDIKPYLRPMSSMTEEEKDELNSISHEFGSEWFDAKTTEERYAASAKMQSRSVDFYNANHLDYHELIPMGLALEAPEGMYKKN